MSITCKEESMRWVHRYAIGGAAFAMLPLPLSTTAGLAALEAHMFRVVGEVYGETVSGVASLAAGGSFEVMGQGLKFLAARAVAFVPPPFGPAIRAGIAAIVIESIGFGIVGHFERKYPGKLFSRAA
jgi:uncharacterized protein (DUF697 family)